LSNTRSDGLPAPATAAAKPDEDASVEELMEAYVGGSKAAFDLLYQRIGSRLFGYLIRLTHERERAEDLLQVTFTKLHRARDSYLRGAPVLPWVFAIARRAFLDERRRVRSRQEDLSHDGTLPEPTPEAAPGQLSDALELALARLPDNYREAIVLTKITGLSVIEAAEVLGTTPTAVKLRVHRGYKELRQYLEEFQRTR
jgi:RNA polymerase sigma-70 factor (ECF subfamily)